LERIGVKMEEFNFPKTVYVCNEVGLYITKIIKLNIVKSDCDSYFGPHAIYGCKENYILDHKNYFYIYPKEDSFESPRQTRYFLTEEEIKKYIEDSYNSEIKISQRKIAVAQAQIEKCKDFLKNGIKTIITVEE
jgi:hypothetical protein